MYLIKTVSGKVFQSKDEWFPDETFSYVNSNEKFNREKILSCEKIEDIPDESANVESPKPSDPLTELAAQAAPAAPADNGEL